MIHMKCKTCGIEITKDNAIPEGYCTDCIEKTNKLLAILDKLIPYDE